MGEAMSGAWGLIGWCDSCAVATRVLPRGPVAAQLAISEAARQ